MRLRTVLDGEARTTENLFKMGDIRSLQSERKEPGEEEIEDSQAGMMDAARFWRRWGMGRILRAQ